MSSNLDGSVHQPDSIGNYTIVEQLGRGGFGTTYKARDNRQSEDFGYVVLKQIEISQTQANGSERNHDYLDNIRREADILQGLTYPYIPKFIESFDLDSYFYIVQEYIEGDDLTQEIIANKPISEKKAINILQEILPILQFIHRSNIIHRDVKPANIIRSNVNNKLYLIDFGAVKEVATQQVNASGITLTRAIGTPVYAPREQLHGAPQFNSDIYALGIMLMQAVTGFSISEISDPNCDPRIDVKNGCRYIWEKQAFQISSKLKQIISKAIEPDFSDRYQSATKMLADVEDLISSPDTDITSPVVVLRRRNTKTIFKPIAIAIGACVAIISISTVFRDRSSCSLIIGDNISCGEEVLNPQSKGNIRKVAAEKFRQKDYLTALNTYKESFQKERRDAETLIYLNNSFLEASKSEYHTIAIAVPTTSDRNNEIKSASISQDFLRGIAQVQTEVNLNLVNSQRETTDDFPGRKFLRSRLISNNNRLKGLKVVIVNDANNEKQAQNAAQEIADIPNILGIIGHYTSTMSLKTVDIYKNKALAQISYGSTSNYLTVNPRENFFRTVYTVNEETEALIQHILQNNLSDKKIAIFYNPGEDFSNRFKITLEEKLKELNNPNIEIVKRFDFADRQNYSTKLALQEIEKLGVNIFILLPDGQISNSLAKAIELLKQDNGKTLSLGGNPLINPKVKSLQTSQPLNLVVSTFWHPLTDLESQFNNETQQLWGERVNGGTVMAYDATLALVEAIKRQEKPTRKGTIAELSNPDFAVKDGVTGHIEFNTPENGDRINFYPTLVRLKDNEFIPLPVDNGEIGSIAE